MKVRTLTFALGLSVLSSVFAFNAIADDHSPSGNVFRIGTGGSAGTYFPIGSIIANAISTEQNQTEASSQPVIAVAQRSAGSVSNVSDIGNQLVEAALAQANVIHWAYHGIGPFKNEVPITSIRGLATLYLESVHLVVRNDSSIQSVYDLAGKRVSLDEKGSGTQLDMIPILEAFSLDVDSFSSFYLKTADAIDRLQRNDLDAFFLVAGYPVKAVSTLVADGDARIVPIVGPEGNTITKDMPYFTLDAIPPDTYGNKEAVATLGVPAQLIINEKVSADITYQLTKTLWNEETLRQLSTGHPKGNDIQLQSALIGLDVPLHEGAYRFYREQGLLDD